MIFRPIPYELFIYLDIQVIELVHVDLFKPNSYIPHRSDLSLNYKGKFRFSFDLILT